jgi:hypothetical protein
MVDDVIVLYNPGVCLRLMSSLRALRPEYGIAKPWQMCSALWLDMSLVAKNEVHNE